MLEKLEKYLFKNFVADNKNPFGKNNPHYKGLHYDSNGIVGTDSYKLVYIELNSNNIKPEKIDKTFDKKGVEIIGKKEVYPDYKGLFDKLSTQNKELIELITYYTIEKTIDEVSTLINVYTLKDGTKVCISKKHLDIITDLFNLFSIPYNIYFIPDENSIGTFQFISHNKKMFCLLKPILIVN